MNEELIQLINSIKNNFSYTEVEDYQNLLLVIYNSLFLYEDELTSEVKYKIYETLSTVINTIDEEKNNSSSTYNPSHKAENLKILDYVLTPFYMQDGKVRPRYRMFPELIYANMKGS